MAIGYTLLAISLAEFALGLWFVFAYKRQQSTFWYGLFSIGVALYVGANGLGYSRIVSSNVAEHLAWVGGIFTAIFILPFSFTFPLPQRTPRELLGLIIWPLATFIPGLLATNVFVDRVPETAVYGVGYTSPPGPYFLFMIVFFAIYWIWGLKNLLYRFYISDGIHRIQLTALLIGLGASVALASFFDIILPIVHVSHLGYLGSFFSAIWLGFTSYILIKK